MSGLLLATTLVLVPSWWVKNNDENMEVHVINFQTEATQAD